MRRAARVPGLRPLPQLAAKHDGHNGKNPTLAVERKIPRRCYHTLRHLGDAALAMPDTRPQQAAA